MKLILIRHGQSWHGHRRVIGGPRGCTGLTPEGREQAARLLDRLARPGVIPDDALLLCGPWPRARETAEIVQPAVRAPLQVDERLRELDPGEADGLTWDEYTDRYGEFDLVAEPDRPFAPGGDSHHTFVTRLTETFGEFANAYAGRTVVAVAHGGTVLVSMLALIGAPSIPGGDIAKPAHASITEWTHGDRWVLERYNDTAHLE